MKKIYLVFITILLFVIGFFVGRYLYKLNTIDTELLSNAQKKNNIIEENFNSKFSVAETNNSNMKVLPTAVFIFKTAYEKCGHILNEYKKVPANEINLTEYELQQLYPTWKISDFTEKEVTFIQNIEDNCNQHFVIRELDGKLAVYIIDDDNKETLKFETNIETKYLPDIDIEKVRLGIRVNGLEQLNAKLEDYE